MTLKSAILHTAPTSYWPLDDPSGSTWVRDACGLHDGLPSASGVDLAAVPFGAARVPHFDGNLGSGVVIPNDGRYSHDHADALTVACWAAPNVLDFPHTSGLTDQYVHLVEKSADYTHDVEWAFRLYNATNPCRHSRLSFYLFNLGHPTLKGAGAYMEFGRSRNDDWAVRPGRWVFLVGQGEGWIDGTDTTRGAMFFKQGAKADRSPGDKYNADQWNVRPRHGPGAITLGGSPGKTAFRGALGHVALWNRLLTCCEVAEVFSAGMAELAGFPEVAVSPRA